VNLLTKWLAWALWWFRQNCRS